MVALMVCDNSQLMQQVYLKSGFAQPVFHSDQIAGGVVLPADFLGIIIVNEYYQIKPVISIICVGFGFQIAVTVNGSGDIVVVFAGPNKGCFHTKQNVGKPALTLCSSVALV